MQNPRGFGRVLSSWGGPLNPNPTVKVLSTFRKHKVKALLIGGQACILYGAAEFSRDVDLAVMVSPGNIEKIKEYVQETSRIADRLGE